MGNMKSGKKRDGCYFWGWGLAKTGKKSLKKGKRQISLIKEKDTSPNRKHAKKTFATKTLWQGGVPWRTMNISYGADYTKEAWGGNPDLGVPR